MELEEYQRKENRKKLRKKKWINVDEDGDRE